MAITGPVEGPPSKVGVALVDVVAGKDAAIAILAALVGRATSGVGARLHVSLADSATAALVNVAQNTLVSGRPPTRWGNAHAYLVRASIRRWSAPRAGAPSRRHPTGRRDGAAALLRTPRVIVHSTWRPERQ